MTKEEFILPVVREISYYDDESHEELGKGLYYSVKELYRLFNVAGLTDTGLFRVIQQDVVQSKWDELKKLDNAKV